MNKYKQRPKSVTNVLKLNRTKGMRYFYFADSEDARICFDTMHEVLLGRQEGYTTGQLRIVGKITDKLEALGLPRSDMYFLEKAQDANTKTRLETEGKHGLFSLTQVNVFLKLEDTEFELMKNAVNQISWPGRSIKKGNMFLNWFDESMDEKAYETSLAFIKEPKQEQ